MELRDIKKELNQLKKKIDTDLLSKSDLLVLNLLPLTTKEKVELFREVFNEQQSPRKTTTEKKINDF